MKHASKRLLSNSRAGIKGWWLLVEETTQQVCLAWSHQACDHCHQIPHLDTAWLKSLVNDLLSPLISEGFWGSKNITYIYWVIFLSFKGTACTAIKYHSAALDINFALYLSPQWELYCQKYRGRLIPNTAYPPYFSGLSTQHFCRYIRALRRKFFHKHANIIY